MSEEKNQRRLSSSDVLDSLPVEEAEQAREEARRSVREMLRACGVIVAQNKPDDVSLMQFDWEKVREALFGDPPSYGPAAAIAVEHPKDEQEPIEADEIVRILDVLAGGDLDHAEGLAGELLHSHRDAVFRCASRAIRRHLDPSRLDVENKVGEAIQRHLLPDEGRGVRSAGRFPILLTSLAFVTYHRRAQSRLRRPGRMDAVPRALDDSLAWYTT